MGVHIENKELVMIIIHFHLTKIFDKIQKHENEFIVKRNESLVKHTIKSNIIVNYCPNRIIEMIIHEHGKQENKLPKQICSYSVINIRLKKLKRTCCSSKPFYLLHLENYKTTLQKL